MKPDKFDETIRQKLEGIQPNFEEKDWVKFKTYQAAHVPQSFVQRFGRTMLYTAASVAGAAMVFANVYQYRQNQRLDHQLQQAKAQLSHKNNASVPVLSRVDTVYITKYITLKPTENNQYDVTIPLNTHQSEGLQVENRANEAQKAELKIVDALEEQPSYKEGREEAIGIENTQNKATNQSYFSKEKSKPSRITERQAESSSQFQDLNKSQNAKNQPMNSESKPIGEEEFINKEEANEISPNKSIKNLDLLYLEPNQILERLASITPAEIKVQRYAYAYQSAASNANVVSPKETETTPPPPSISFKGVKFRIGAGLNLGDKYTARSLNTSVLLGKYWTLDAGISKAHISGPEFYTEDVFKVKTKKDFDTWHKGKSPNPPQLIVPQAFDIKTNVTLVRMPISLTYRWPIKDGFTLLMSGGTNLNLSAKQAYNFYYRERTGEFIERSGEFDIKTSLGADALIAAGIEKQWRQLVFQGEAYAAPYLQKPTYLTENRNIGVRFRVMYQFGKK